MTNGVFQAFGLVAFSAPSLSVESYLPGFTALANLAQGFDMFDRQSIG